MATTIKQAFQEYRGNLEITDRQSNLVTRRRDNVIAAIGEELYLHADGGRVIGSWARDTLTRLLSEGDVDVMVVLNYGKHEEWDDADGTIRALDRFKAILDRAYPDTTKRRDRNCISMDFSEFRLDVVPAFKYTHGGYKIPDSYRKQWLNTNPFTFAQYITDVNKTMDGKFVPLIKMIKGWNREVGWPIRSFHLECIMYQRYRTYTQGYTYDSMVKVFFEELPGYLAASCYDPVSGERVDGYLDNNAQKTRRTIAIEEAEAASAAAKEAFEDQEEYPSLAIGEWKALLGHFFPAYG